MSGQIDVLAVMDRLEDYYRRHEVLIGPVDDAYSVEHKAARLAVAELIEQMRDVLELWDSNSMSIDGKAATMQCRPEKWRAALAGVGGAK